jgi:hypothetical protein
VEPVDIGRRPFPFLLELREVLFRAVVHILP